MIQLTTTSEKIQIIPGTAGDLDINCDAVDTLLTGATSVNIPNIPPINLTTTTTTDIVPAPASTFARRIKYIGVRNVSTTITTTIIIQKVAATTVELIKVTLLPGWHLVYNGAWFVYDSNGAVVTGPTAGRFLRVTVQTSGTTFVTGVDTDTIIVRMVGGGGGGGGCTSVASAAAAGGGGGGGAYAEKIFDVLPNTTYACVVGALGAGVSGAAGANGTSSTFTVGGTTVTAPGGTGGPVATAATTLTARAGGAGGTISTNGDLNLAGQPGHYGVVLIVATPIVSSGSGGDSQVGAGGLGVVAVGNGNNATGFGGGGGGSATGASAVRTGGSGSQGVIIVEEYT